MATKWLPSCKNPKASDFSLNAFNSIGSNNFLLEKFSSNSQVHKLKIKTIMICLYTLLLFVTMPSQKDQYVKMQLKGKCYF